MDEFERNSFRSQEREIENVSEAEHVLDKVLSTGQNFYKHDNMSGRGSRASKRSRTQDSRRSLNSNQIGKRLNSRGSLKSNRSVQSRLSQQSKKSIVNSMNRFKGTPKKQEIPVFGSTQKKAQAFTGKRHSLGMDLDNVNRMSNAINSKISKLMMPDVSEDPFFRNGSLLKLPPVNRPVISLIDPGRITFVAANDAHSKESNFGYSRNKLGGFYHH